MATSRNYISNAVRLPMKCSRSVEDISCATNLESKKQTMDVQDEKSSQVAKEVSKSKTKKSNNKGVKRNPSQFVNKQKKATRLKKKASSITTGSKWQPIPQTLLNVVMAMLEDSISPFSDSGNNAAQSVLDKITVNVQQTLKKLKVPKVMWTDSKSLQNSKKILLTEKKRLEDLECALSSTLEEEIRQTTLLQTERDRLKTLTTAVDDQMDAILQRPQESL